MVFQKRLVEIADYIVNPLWRNAPPR